MTDVINCGVTPPSCERSWLCSEECRERPKLTFWRAGCLLPLKLNSTE
jgi:hypothetical protein